VRALVGILALAACAGTETTPPQTPPVAKAIVADAAPPIDAARIAPTLRLPDDVVPAGYDLALELDPASNALRGTVTIRVTIATRTDRVYLHAQDLELEEATWQRGATSGTLTALGVPPDPQELRAFGFGAPLEPGEATLHFRYTGHVTDDEPEALFRQKHAGRWYILSQGESVFARRILPCFDEPRFKVPWRVALTVPSGALALANAPLDREAKATDGRRTFTFAATPPMPSYLLAIAVGPFELVDAGVVGANQVKLRVAALAGEAGKVPLPAQLAPGMIEQLEAYFDSPLPWPKLDLVVVPRFFGAMENPGLITFDRDIIVGTSASTKRRFTTVGGHEFAHLWFGDLVTFAWWDDLWLAEAFASWMSDKLAVTAGVIPDLAFERASQRAHAMRADDAVDAHALRRTIERSSDAETRFDAISYEKGAAVLAMFERVVGGEAFKRGVRGYIAKHRDGNATSADLFAAIAQVTRPDIARAFAAYVERPGVPIVDFTVACKASGATLVATPREADRPVPYCVRYPGTTACGISDAKLEVPLASCPGWLATNDGGLGYYRTGAVSISPALDQLSAAELMAHGDDLAAAVLRGELASKDAFARIAALAATDAYAAHGALAIADAVDRVIDDAARAKWIAWLAATFGRYTNKPGVMGRLSELGATPPAIAARAKTQLSAALDVKTSLEWVTHLASAATAVDKPLFAKLVAVIQAQPATTRRWAIAELALVPATFAADVIALELAQDKPVGWAIERLLERGATRTAAWTALQPRAREVAAKLSLDDLADVIEATGALCDAKSRGEVAAAFEAGDALTAALATIDRCIATRAKLGAIAVP